MIYVLKNLLMLVLKIYLKFENIDFFLKSFLPGEIIKGKSKNRFLPAILSENLFILIESEVYVNLSVTKLKIII